MSSYNIVCEVYVGSLLSLDLWVAAHWSFREMCHIKHNVSIAHKRDFFLVEVSFSCLHDIW